MEEIKIHDHGFVRLIDTFGSDQSIENAARISYGEGTRKSSDTRNLIRYLISHKHTSPVEQAEVQFHLKLPIFIMRQLIRHRTANVNEYSARYSVLTDEFYLPENDYIEKQSTTNKQGRDGDLNPLDKEAIVHLMSINQIETYDLYTKLIDLGLTRELARTVLPVSGYTQCVWKMDLHNFLHFCKLRMDKHAQREIQDYANAMYSLIKPKFPIVCEAFEDYILNGRNLSSLEIEYLRCKILGQTTDFIADKMSKREFEEFEKWYEKVMG